MFEDYIQQYSPETEGIFSSEAEGRGRKNAEVEGLYCWIEYENTAYIQYISHFSMREGVRCQHFMYHDILTTYQNNNIFWS